MQPVKLVLFAAALLVWTGAFVPAQLLVRDSGAAIAQQDPPPAPAEQPAAQQPQQPAAPPPDVHVTVENGGLMFFANPWVLATAGVALLIAIALIAMSTRGGGTTIVREK